MKPILIIVGFFVLILDAVLVCGIATGEIVPTPENTNIVTAYFVANIVVSLPLCLYGALLAFGGNRRNGV